MLSTTLMVFCFAVPLFGDTPEQPVGLILQAPNSKVVRLNSETPLGAKPGDLLFAGDTLRTEASAASFLFCPANKIDTLAAAGEVRFEAKEPKVKTGKLSEQQARSCSLPRVLRVAVASQQHYGVTMVRGADQATVAPVPRAKLATEVQAAIAPFETALGSDPNDPASLVGLADVFEKSRLPANALDAYSRLRTLWPDAAWLKSKIFELQQGIAETATTAVTAAAAGGQTYALLIGISKFKSPELLLQFANADAAEFGKVLNSPRGGGITPENLLLLTDEKATLAAVRLGFQNFLKRRAGKNDTVVILIASHGTVEIPGSKGAYILTYDSDPQDLKSTALPMAELKGLFEEQLSKVGRVVIFADVCRASTIGSIHSTTVNADVQRLQDAEGQLLGLMGSRARELSFEGPQFGNGHGAFSYFVLKGVSGAADENSDGLVDGNELIRYVVTQVPKATGDKQHPTDISNSDVGNIKLSDVRKPGVNVAHWPKLYDFRNHQPVELASAQPQLPPGALAAQDAVERFEKAVRGHLLLPGEQGNAFGALADLKSRVSPERYAEASNLLRVALDNSGQDLLVRYLAGDERPPTRDDFDAAVRYTAAARSLTSESLLLEARENFFRGRTLLFDKKFAEATSLLETAIRFDPNAAYAYNALGIGYLEQAQFDKALPAFRDAIRRAPHWSYPLHNEALAFVEMGDTKSAIRAYQQAIQLTPRFSYLHYNLGLVYQRVNRRNDAEAAYKTALELAPNLPEPWNALGTLLASEGKRQQAETYYRQALDKRPGFLPARHNLALLLSGEKNRAEEAISLWRANLKEDPEHLPSHVSLAGFLATCGDVKGAIEEYQAVLRLRSEYTAARIALAGLYKESGDPENAIRELRKAADSARRNPEALEQLGDIEASRQHVAEARAAYDSAKLRAADKSVRKRIEKKLSALK